MSLVKRSFSLLGHQTSVALEPEFWTVLERLAQSQGKTLTHLVRDLDEGRGEAPLASTARLAALSFALGEVHR